MCGKIYLNARKVTPQKTLHRGDRSILSHLTNCIGRDGSPSRKGGKTMLSSPKC